MLEKVNILMVDDQPGKLLSYEAILAPLGEKLIKAHSGKEALEHLLKTDIAIVLLDVNMPELDGFELADMIHQHPRFQDTAIIFISAIHLTDIDRLQGYERGAVDYISVPIIPELLRAKVKVFAALYRKTRQLEMLNCEMQRLSSRMITMQDEERRRIAREMHDGLGQDLTAAAMVMKAIRAPELREKLAEATGFIDNAIKQVRSISYLLHPPLLDVSGLGSAIRWFIEGLGKRSGIETVLETQPADFPRLAVELETALYRIMQEALTNVFRHSSARHAWITLTLEEGRVAATVRDDGKGVPERIVTFRPGSIGVGVAGMMQRVKEFGGEFRIENADPGTVLEVVIPIPATVLDNAVSVRAL
jgi:signal transduction histidine kinase